MKYSSMILICLLNVILGCTALYQSKSIANSKQVFKNLDSSSYSTQLLTSSFPMNKYLRSNTKLYSNILDLRGGYQCNILSKLNEYALSSPTNLFNSLLVGLIGLTILGRVLDSKSTQKNNSMNQQQIDAKPNNVKSLQFRFLTVFWLIRMADWLQGPYFYEVYSSKVFNGIPASLDLVSKLFLVGFASTGIFGPWIGRFVDTVGRKAGTLAFAVLYTIGNYIYYI